MTRRDPSDAIGDICLNGGRSTSLEIHMQTQHLVACDEIVRVVAKHFMKKNEPFSVETKNSAFHTQPVAKIRFLFVGHMSLADENRATALLPIDFANVQVIEHRVGRMIEHQNVISHVHVIVVVYPFGKHGFAVQAQRSVNVLKCRMGHGCRLSVF